MTIPFVFASAVHTYGTPASVDSGKVSRASRRGSAVALAIAVAAHLGVLYIVLCVDSPLIALQSTGRPASSSGVEVTLISEPTASRAPQQAEHAAQAQVPVKPATPRHTSRAAHVLSSTRSDSPDAVHDEARATPATPPTEPAPTAPAPATSVAPAAATAAPSAIAPALSLPATTAAKGVKSLACSFPQPSYSSHAKRLGEEGIVMLRVSIDAAGRVTQVEVTQSSGYADLDGAARQALLDGACQPYIDNGLATPVSAIQPVSFRIDR